MSARLLMQRACRSAGHTTRRNARCNLALVALQEPSVCRPPDAAPHSWGRSQSLGLPSGGFETWMYVSLKRAWFTFNV